MTDSMSTFSPRRPALAWFAFAAVAVFATGCGGGGGGAHLAGTVTINGETIPAEAKAGLSFEPTAEGEAVSTSIVDGRYDVTGVPLGRVNVKFYASRPVGPVRVSERTGKEYQETQNLVPPDRAAGVTIQVDGDNLQQDFDL